MKVELVPITNLVPDPNNPRRGYGDGAIQRLGDSLRQHGVRVPLIGYRTGDQITLEDGHCRLAGAQLIGMAELPIVILDKKPTESELLVTQLTVNGHRQALNSVDECAAFERLIALNKWTPGQLAKALAISNSEVTSILSIAKLSDVERELVRSGRIPKSSAYALARMPAEERADWARRAAAGEVTRDQLNARARKPRQCAGQKTKRVHLVVPEGAVSVQSSAGMDLTGLMELFEGLLRELKKMRSQGIDIATASRVLRDRTRHAAAAKH